MYLYQLNTEYSLTVIVFWFFVSKKLVDETEGEINCRNDTSVEISLYVIEPIVCMLVEKEMATHSNFPWTNFQILKREKNK